MALFAGSVDLTQQNTLQVVSQVGAFTVARGVDPYGIIYYEITLNNVTPHNRPIVVVTPHQSDNTIAVDHFDPIKSTQANKVSCPNNQFLVRSQDIHFLPPPTKIGPGDTGFDFIAIVN